MKRVTGIGGIFFKAKDPKALGEWYRKHLGIDVQDWGGTIFEWNAEGKPNVTGVTAWNIFSTSEHLAPSTAPFMINYRVEDLHALLSLLRAEDCIVDDKVEESEYGKFGWLMDPEGNRIELWEPPVGS
ncbi:MAG: VOC family protein [Gammaproteobacteria bacterium]|nr:VOC family protein [Gammaproteobacteria bacterium]